MSADLSARSPGKSWTWMLVIFCSDMSWSSTKSWWCLQNWPSSRNPTSKRRGERWKKPGLARPPRNRWRRSSSRRTSDTAHLLSSIFEYHLPLHRYHGMVRIYMSSLVFWPILISWSDSATTLFDFGWYFGFWVRGLIANALKKVETLPNCRFWGCN